MNREQIRHFAEVLKDISIDRAIFVFWRKELVFVFEGI